MTWEEISKELFEEKTGKRFTTKNIICSNYCVWDNNDKPYGNDEVVELLNELHEENQELKQEMGDLGTTHAEEINKIEDEFDEEILKLEKENEQLKSFIKKLTNRNGEILLMNGYEYTKSYVEKLLNEKELEE